MRVALFAETYLPYINGVVTHVNVLKDGLEEMGHQVMVIAPDPKAEKHFLKDGVLHCPAYSLKKKALYGYSLSKPFSKKRMRYLEEFNPDILHMHQEFSMGLFATSVAKRLKKPLVYTLHTMYDEYIFYIAPNKLVPAAKSVSHRYARYIANKADVITSPSVKAKGFLERCKVDKSIEVIPNSIDISAFDPDVQPAGVLKEISKKLSIREGDTTGIFVGRLGKEKSVDLVIGYWAKFFKEDKRLRLIVVGDGPEKEVLREQAQALGVADQIVFTGSVPHEEIPPYYLACDFFVTASVTEMMSISMLEAMASGLPSIQRYDELNAGQVKEGINGFLYRRPEELADYVRQIAAMNQEERVQMKQRVRDSIRHAGKRDLAQYMVNVYEKVVGIKRNSL